jgi:hypothetical protein
MQPARETMRPLLGCRCMKRRSLLVASGRHVVAASCPTPRRPLTGAAPMTAGSAWIPVLAFSTPHSVVGVYPNFAPATTYAGQSPEM